MDNVFAEKLIKLNYPAVDKKSLLQEMATDLADHNVITSAEAFFEEIWKRESIMSTGIGKGIAIPHSCNSSVTAFSISVWKLAEPLDFDSIDEKPVSIVFMVAVPLDKQSRYMKILSAISNFIRQPDKNEKLNTASSIAELLNVLKHIKIQT